MIEVPGLVGESRMIAVGWLINRRADRWVYDEGYIRGLGTQPAAYDREASRGTGLAKGK